MAADRRGLTAARRAGRRDFVGKGGGDRAMVADSRAAGGVGRLRPLNRPRQVQVEADQEGRPLAIHLSNRRLAVEEIVEIWRIDDEWWRKHPISRMYYRL